MSTKVDYESYHICAHTPIIYVYKQRAPTTFSFHSFPLSHGTTTYTCTESLKNTSSTRVVQNRHNCKSCQKPLYSDSICSCNQAPWSNRSTFSRKKAHSASYVSGTQLNSPPLTGKNGSAPSSTVSVTSPDATQSNTETCRNYSGRRSY